MATATAKKIENPFKETLNIVHPFEAVPYLNSLIYGNPGVGKTTLLGTAQDHPMTTPVLIIDVEAGVTTLRRRKDIDVISVRTVDEIVKIHKELHDNPGYYKTVGLDSVTELQKLDMRGIMREVVMKRPDLDEDVPSQREWGKSGERMRRIVRAFRDLPCHTLMTALVSEQRDNENVLMFQPSLPGKLRQEVPGFLDIVGYMTSGTEDGEIVRTIQFTGTRRVTAKDRTDALGDLVKNPTVPMLWDLIHSTDTSD